MQFFHNITATPKKRALTLVALGVCATLSLPPFFLLPFLFISSCGWLSLLLRAKTKWQAFRTGWWWGLGFFISGLYWTSISLLVDAERFAWMIPFNLFGLNALIAIFPGLASVGFYILVTSIIPPACGGGGGEALDKKAASPLDPPVNGGRVEKRSSLQIVLLFTLCWSVSEWLRSTILTGFPWNLVGYSWADYLAPMQVSSLIGIHGLTLITMLLSLTPMLYKYGVKNTATKIVFVWMLLISWGMWRVDAAPQQNADAPSVLVVQANIEQSLKWDPKARIAGIRKHMQLTEEYGAQADIIVWPESAVTFPINREKMLEADLKNMLKPGQLLVTGSTTVNEEPGKPPEFYNSVYALDSENVLDVYQKHHLVPFGEYVPLRNVLPLDKISPGAFDYSPGPGPQTVALENWPPYSPLVCYEAIFANEAVAKDQRRPKWLVNVTNDAWFGDSSGPYQHLHMTRFRAVEQGLPLVRAANTGISAVIDPYGQVVEKLPLNQSGAIRARLPQALPPTLYYFIGDWSYVILLLAFGAAILGCVRFQGLKS